MHTKEYRFLFSASRCSLEDEGLGQVSEEGKCPVMAGRRRAGPGDFGESTVSTVALRGDVQCRPATGSSDG